MSSAAKYIPHYTFADYRQWEGDWELWSGIPVAMTPSPFGRHQWVAGKILSQINHRLGEADCADCYVVGETDWVVSDDTVVRPDISVVCGEFPERFIEHSPVAVVEVLSERTAEKDRTAKFALYRQAGVRYYLLVDPSRHAIDAFALGPSGEYTQLEAADEIRMELHATCTICLRIPDCFR